MSRLVSVIMPSFNQAQFLPRAIDSVLDQTGTRLELLVFDGGSTDGSRAILEAYSDRLTYWQCQADGGQSAALRLGFEMARGQLLGWLNSDDVLLPGALAKVVAAYDGARPAAESVLIAGNVTTFDSYGRVLQCKRYPADPRPHIRRGFVAINQPGSFYSRAAYDAAGGIDPDLRYVMDTDLYLRMLLETAVQYVFVDEYLAGFRMHAQSKTVGSADAARREYQRLATTRWQAMGLGCRDGAALSFRLRQLASGRYLRMAYDTALGRYRRGSQLHPEAPYAEAPQNHTRSDLM